MTDEEQKFFDDWHKRSPLLRAMDKTARENGEAPEVVSIDTEEGGEPLRIITWGRKN